VQPSSAGNLEQSFAGLAKCFVPGKVALAELETALFNQARLPRRLRRRVPLVRLPIARARHRTRPLRRPICDHSSIPTPFACHPYDVCTAMLLEEAGGVSPILTGDLSTCPSTRRPRWRGSGKPPKRNVAAAIGPILSELVDDLPDLTRPT